MKTKAIIASALLIGIEVIAFEGNTYSKPTSESTISTGILDTTKTFEYAADSNSVHQIVYVTDNWSRPEFRIIQKSRDSSCNFELSGILNRMRKKSDRGCFVPIVKKEANKRYLGKNKGCIVDITFNSKWMAFATAECGIRSECPNTAITALKFSRETIDTKWIEYPSKQIVLPSR